MGYLVIFVVKNGITVSHSFYCCILNVLLILGNYVDA